MNKWIRWWGIIAFFAIIVVFIGAWYIFADKIIERNIEKTGEYIVGAQVDIGNVDLSIIPLGITLENLNVTNPNEPMKNLFAVDNIRFHIDGKYLFERKVIIQDMVMEGLKFNTDRSTSGKIEGGKPLTVKRAYDDFVMPLLDLSKLKTFVEQEELQSIENLNAVINDFNRVNNEWQAAYRMMPTMDDVKNYQNRTEKILADLQKNKIEGLLVNGKNIKDLRKEIEHDIDIIKINKKAMLIDIDSLQTKKNRALNSFEDDYTHLREKYTPDIQGLKNFSKYIFKDDILRQIDEGIEWYNKLSPIFDYAYNKIKDDYYGSKPLTFDGIDVKLPEYNPKPSFLVELAKLSFEKEYGNLMGEIKNFSVQQNITGLPTSISLSGKNLEYANSVSINALFDHINKENIKDDFSIRIDKQKLDKRKYSILENWDLTISDGFIDKNFDINIHNGLINSKIKIGFTGTSFASNYSGNNNIIISSIESVIKKVSNFDINVSVKGTPGEYTTTINSNLDNLIDNAVREIASREAEKVKNIIYDSINSQKETLLNNFENEMDRLKLKMAQVDKLQSDFKTILNKLP